MSINKVRKGLYKTARILGDINAIKKAKLGNVLVDELQVGKQGKH